jgi:hypothetical protein
VRFVDGSDCEVDVADLDALRDHINSLMRNHHPTMSVHALYNAIQRVSADGAELPGRTSFYSWFRDGAQPKHLLLECVPALSRALGVDEYEFWRIAKVLPPEVHSAAALLSAANDFRDTLRMMTRATMDAGLLSDGVAIVVDRVMNSGLDFRITILPTVRGYAKEIHVHSWIVLEPAEPAEPRMSRLRRSVSPLAGKSPAQQREQIRREVITEALWRSLGLRWRIEPGPELPYNFNLDLCIEIPAEERNRLPAAEAGMVPNVTPDRILVLSAPFGHAELLAAFMGNGLGFGTVDLRYQGFHDPRSDQEVVQFCLDTVAERSSRYVWSISEAADILTGIEDAIVQAASNHLVVGISYGPVTRGLGAEIWGVRSADLIAADRVVSRILRKINASHPMIAVEYNEADYLSGESDKTRQVDMNSLTDHVRYSAADAMNLIYDKCNGPPASHWGDRFDDLIYGAGTRARIPARSTRVRWCEPDTYL